ncbi:MAG: M20/M25/M40 family metallo-hydrolase [Longimicrobiales bacterium]|nr:M20/M25/M40 family metallo-hydrolase [Longimicrobiales bacterium]
MSALAGDVPGRAAAGDPVALAQALVAIPSVNPKLAPGGAGEAEIAAACTAWLGGWGFDARVVEVAPGRCNVVATLGGEGPTLLLNGHLDTVGVEGMVVPPFGGPVQDGRLPGRGSCDMKGGVAALMSAAARLARGGPRPKLIVALTADEEHASLGMDALVRSGVKADLAVVCEPTRLAVMPAHKGFVWIRAAFRGRAAHGSRPELGVDAIRHAGLYLSALDGYAAGLRGRAAHPLLGHGSFHAGTIRGGTAESVYPDACELLLERRTLPGEDPSAVVAEFQGVLDALATAETTLDANLETTLDRPGTEVPTASRLVQGLLNAGAGLGLPRAVEGMTAWVDAAFLNEAGTPAVCFGPGDIAQAHCADEWIEVRQIGACADVLERFARELAAGG